MEETKYQDPGKFTVENYHIFELVRQSRDGGGGLALGCQKDLHPVWVREGDDLVESLSVEIHLKNLKIRCCIAYGCQENDSVGRKESFWSYLDEEVQYADQAAAGFVLHMDGNLWAGDNIIPGDPRPQNRNGKMFHNFLQRHPHLTVVNSLALCEGLITRSRMVDGKVQKSVLDFFVICHRVLPFLNKMVIDESKTHILTNYQNIRNGGKVIDSDHFTQYMDLNLKIETVKPERIEMFNFKNEEGQKLFKEITTNTNEFSNCFANNAPLADQIVNWQKVLKSSCRKSFKKIRIKKQNVFPMNDEISKLIDQRNSLVNSSDDGDKEVKLAEISLKISNMEADENRKKLMDNFQQFSDNPENVNVSKMWKLLKKLWPKNGNSSPTAKMNHLGKIVSGPKELKLLLAKEYKERLRTRPVRPDLRSMKVRKNRLFRLKLKLATAAESPDWTIENLDQVLARLKNNKSRDHDGYINEIFKKDVIGNDLKNSMVIMFNKLKKKKMIALFMNFANITTVPKRGSRLILKNERGIFRVNIVRSILMGLIYDTKYSKIDCKMSDCQMGGRKKKGCKNNIFILNGLIHEVLKSKKMKPILLQFYDYSQMFDSINLQSAISDIYDTGVDDDQLVLLYNANKEINMAVKTANGLSDRQIVSDIVLQGDTFGSILASVQVDKIGQDCMAAGHYYLYKNILPVGFLGLVDDIVGITEAGHKAQQLNSFINVKTAEKMLQFGHKKCKSMLVGKNTESVLNNKLIVDNWKVEHFENKTTGEADLVETYDGKIAIEKAEEYTYLGFVISSKGDNMANIRQVQNKSNGVIRKIINKLNSLNLRQYYFECALLLMNVMLRSSILYAADMYYNLKENELRQIERIEEGYLRKIFKTAKGCPIIQLYLEVGQFPARFEIQKMRLLYLKYILEQDNESKLKKFLILQMNEPSRGDWASTCMNDLKMLDIDCSLEEIKIMTKNKFNRILKEKIKVSALKYLLEKKGHKGKEIEYGSLQMAEYLQPFGNKLTVEEKRELFSIRNRMVDIPDNFPRGKTEFKCICGEQENMSHLYNCELLSEKKEKRLEYEKIFNGTINQQIEIFRIIQQNLNQREATIIEMITPCDPSDPLYSVMD